ncbi:hypothetical protein HDU84_003253 [Entophlyctis sp. JEL0112]|nr:hypothetical protein HDU84_003253 [Entophlyctis sp. JEL0112]
MSRSVDYVVVDVRDGDFANGNIVGAVNIPAYNFVANPQAYADQLGKTKKVIFHCLMSQVRGPKCANAYQQTLSPDSSQEVYVLEGGFSAWGGSYGGDETLTENFNARFWESGGYE